MEKYKYAGKKLRVKEGAGMSSMKHLLDGCEFIAEDYWINLTGESWLDTNLGNPAVMEFSIRYGCKLSETDPEVDKVVYGKVGLFGHLFHESELELMED